MAKLSINQRFPHFGLILVVAVMLAIPLTVWSLQNASTQTQQHAASSCSSLGGTCTPSGVCGAEGSGTISGGVCSTGQVCCNFLTPYGLDSAQWKCGTPPNEKDGANFWWSTVKNATSYSLYYRIYGTSVAYKSISVGNNTQQLIGDIFKNLNGRHIQWYVTATNDKLTGKSNVTTTHTAFPSCGY